MKLLLTDKAHVCNLHELDKIVHMTLTQRANLIPPCVARIMAKESGRLMSDKQLMGRTGWGRKKLISVYQRASFARVPIEDVDRFLSACGITSTNKNKVREKIKLALGRGEGGVDGISRMYHLRYHSGWESSQLKRHLKRIEQLLAK